MILFLKLGTDISSTPYNVYTAMIRFLELDSGISSTPDVMVIPP